jgi:hypothetical protein
MVTEDTLTLAGLFLMAAALYSSVGHAGVSDEHNRSSQDENEFVFVSVPMALTRPGARA